MSNFILVDTDILVDVGRNNIIAFEYLQAVEISSILAISIITHMELIVGCQNKSELQSLDHFIKRFRVFKLNEFITDTAIGLLLKYRLSHGVLIADALIAATAISINIPFVTKNQRDFHFINGLNLIPYP